MTNLLSPIDTQTLAIFDTVPERRMTREPIDHDEYMRIKEAIPYTDVNARLYFEILRNTGCRASEIKSITPSHIGQNGPEVWIEIRRGKTREKVPTYTQCWLNSVLGQQLIAYVRGQRLKADALIFPRSHQWFWKIWSKASLQGIGRHSRIHDIRNVFSTYLFDNGFQPAQVAAMLGHKDIKVTMAHYNQMNRDKRRLIGQRTPV